MPRKPCSRTWRPSTWRAGRLVLGIDVLTKTSQVLAACAFSLTGFAALVFEIVWIRQTVLILGVSVYAYAAVVTAFLGGGALGNWWFGRIVDRIERPLRLIAFLQSGAAGLALLTWLILPNLRHLYALVARELPLGTTPVFLWRCLLAALILTPTAILMGGTVPALGRWLARNPHSARTAQLGCFYALETLGAAVGCITAALWLLRYWPSSVSMYAAVGTSLWAAVIFWLVQSREYRRRSNDSASSRQSSPAAMGTGTALPHRSSPTGILLLYAGSGFIALGCQMVWARILAIFTLDAVFSFAIVLTTFLMGLALGSALAARYLRRNAPTLDTFARLQFLLALGGLLTIWLFYALPLISFEAVFGYYTLSRAVLFEFLLGILILLLPTSVMGYLFPVTVHLVKADDRQLGGAAGRVSGANTAGAIVGILGTTFGLVPWVGLQGSLWLLAGGSFGLGLLALWTMRRKSKAPGLSIWFRPTAVAACLVLGFWFRPPPVYLGFRQDPSEHLVFYEEGVETTVAVFHVVSQDFKVSFVDGRIEVPTDAVSMRAFRALGHLPPLVHPDAQRALMLSFGNGVATGSLDTHGIPHIDAVDLSREMMQAAELYWEENYNVLRSPRLGLYVEDGRNFLLQTTRQYDIVTVDATHPSNTSSWALFTREFYESAQARMTPTGIFFQWLPFHSMTEADFRTILRTFQASFPHATLWYTGSSHSLMMGTATPFDRQDLEAMLDRMEQHATASFDLGGRQQVHDYFTLDERQWRAYAGAGPVATDRQVYFVPARDQVEAIAAALLVARGA